MIYLSLKKKKLIFLLEKILYHENILPKRFYLNYNGHMQMVFVHRVYTGWKIAELTKQIFINIDMDTEISDRLKYFDNLRNGNNYKYI